MKFSIILSFLFYAGLAPADFINPTAHSAIYELASRDSSAAYLPSQHSKFFVRAPPAIVLSRRGVLPPKSIKSSPKRSHYSDSTESSRRKQREKVPSPIALPAAVARAPITAVKASRRLCKRGPGSEDCDPPSAGTRSKKKAQDEQSPSRPTSPIAGSTPSDSKGGEAVPLERGSLMQKESDPKQQSHHQFSATTEVGPDFGAKELKQATRATGQKLIADMKDPESANYITNKAQRPGDLTDSVKSRPNSPTKDLAFASSATQKKPKSKLLVSDDVAAAKEQGIKLAETHGETAAHAAVNAAQGGTLANPNNPKAGITASANLKSGLALPQKSCPSCGNTNDAADFQDMCANCHTSKVGADKKAVESDPGTAKERATTAWKGATAKQRRSLVAYAAMLRRSIARQQMAEEILSEWYI